MSKNQPFFAHLGDKKTQFRADDKFRFRKSCRDKIESNLQSQMYVERTPGLEESRFPAELIAYPIHANRQPNSRAFPEPFSESHICLL
jgi:hypothetical protein